MIKVLSKIKISVKSFLKGDIEFNRNFLFLALIIFSAYLLFNNLSVNPLSTDGYYYANLSKNMVINNDYITFVNADNEIDFTSGKGHLFYWIYALSGALLGFSDFAMRLPAAVLGFACVIIVFLFLSKRRGYKFAFISAAVLLLTQQFLHHSRAVHPDGNFAVFFTFAVFAFYIAVSGDKPLFYYLFGICLAISISIRQAVGLFIIPVVFFYVLTIPERKKIFLNKHLWLSLILAVLIVLPWYIAAYDKYGEKFLIEYLATPYKILTGANFETSPFDDSGRITYLNILLANYQPWFIFLIVGSFVTIKKIIKEKLIFNQSFEKFIIIWAYIPLILFLAMSGHKYYFLLPLYIPFSMLSAFGLLYVFRKKGGNAVISYLLTALMLLSFLCFAFKLFPRTLDNQHYVNTVKILPEMNAVGDNGDKIYTLDRAKYYNALLMFYRDKPNVIHIEENEFMEMFNSSKQYYFVVYKKTFDEIGNTIEAQIIGRTKEDVLFTNKKRDNF
ncbi:MAG: glycosyltransferase family 39 protein [Elusimicrobiota bacterium]|jgi:4-amino-4-deoxy-L-arabinose transferase-like glycosyltransferase|nr:glycosyltransferase family 39 protein [Elusimicrobiota bacterium]